MAFLSRLRGGRLVVAVGVLAILLLVVSRAATALYVEALWYGSLGYGSVFWKELRWVWGVRTLTAVLVAVILHLNLRMVARGFGSIQIRRRFGNLEIAERIPAQYLTWGSLLVSGLLGLWFGASIPEDVARSVLFRTAAVSWGQSDPFLGLDLSFYAFSLPLLRAGVTFALVVVFLAFSVVAGGYAATGTLRFGQGGLMVSEGARRHLGVLAAVFLALLGLRIALGMPLLLLFGNSDVQGIFGYADARARLRVIPVEALVVAASAGAVVVGAWRNRLVPVVLGVGASILAVVGLGQLYPAFVQRFQVVPNELARETPYIERNLEFTRRGFGLDDLERVRFEARRGTEVDWAQAARQFDGLPVWTSGTLLTTFREVEARFRYYDFNGVTMDRYPDPGGDLVPVSLAVREVDPAGIEEANWQNLHLRERYVVGNGAVAVDAAGRTPEGRPRTFLAGLPPEFSGEEAPLALELRRPSIFIGSRARPPYALVTPTDSAFLAPDATPGEAGVDFPRGVEVGGLARKLALAWYLREANILFSSELDRDSRLVMRRGVQERVQTLAPFLRFPEAPYAVIHDGKVVWILEGFTATRFYPLSTAFDLTLGRPVSYARNSVKITVDAVTGETTFYRVPGDDPLLETYARAYPEVFRPLSEMPPELERHLRYARSLLDLQSRVLLQYHQETAATFFGQQDVWAAPQELASTTQPVPYRPEYGLMRMPGDDSEAFRLVTSFVPSGRQNLTGLLSGELRPDGSYRLRLFDVPVENQVPGPRQVEALVEQDPEISQQFSLWRTGGSRVWTGHLHLVPVGDRVVYMEPVFLAAEADAIPELRRFVVSDGERVAMEESLSGALATLGADVEGAPPTESETGVEATGVPSEALRLLDEAEARLRQGDWAGFGAALQRLRTLLRGSSGGDGSG